MLHEKLKKLKDHYENLEKLLASSLDSKEYASLSKEYRDLEDLMPLIYNILKKKQEFEEIDHLLKENKDIEMKDFLQQEWYALKEELPKLEEDMKIRLLPKDVDDERDVILEIRAGTGGDEAGLFAADLMRMYQRYSDIHRWSFEILDMQESGLGAIKDASCSIKGRGVFARLKFESGVHRVQRVPVTEAGGRIHTSTATVAVLPEVEDVEIHIDEKDLQIDVYRASGAGGQHVNKTDSAVRITHIPTGLVVAQQEDRSQHKNKAKALKILKAKLYQQERDKRLLAQATERKSQVGTGERSERIRTYNYPQGRVSDHRINLTLYKLQQVLEGASLDEIIDQLIAHDQIEKLQQA